LKKGKQCPISIISIFLFKKIFLLILFSVILLIRAFCFSLSQSEKADITFCPVRTDRAEIHIDGYLDEPIWKIIPPLKEWYQLKPNEGEKPSEKTEMWLFYDENAIYLGANLWVNDLTTIIVRSLERDNYTPDQDAIAIILDTFNDDRTGYGFIVNSSGVRTDTAIVDDAETSWNTNWNAFWDAAVCLNKDGWSAEVRIPFTSLRFKNQAGSTEMGLILWRYIARKVEYDIFPAIPNKWNFTAYKPSQALGIRFENIETKHPIYLRPYVMGGLEQEYVLSRFPFTYELHNHWRRKAGLDLKYNISSNLVLDLTLNTDFAQVEADDQQINLTRFTLFFPEKRPFFQERADLFDLRVPIGGQKLFHSRSIGIAQGESVPIIGGVRLTGRIGNWQIGCIEMQTANAYVNGQKIGAENFGVIRLKREVMHDGSYVGGMFTSRADFRGNYNFVFAADADLSLKAPYAYLKFSMARTYEPQTRASKSFMGAVVLESRIWRGFSYAFVARHIGSEFHPRMGFLSRGGVNLLDNRLEYNWVPKSASALQSHGIQNKIIGIWNSDTRRFETLDYDLQWQALFRSGANIQINLKALEENLIESFSLGKVTIKPGGHRFAYLDGNYHSTSGLPFQLAINAICGGFYNGRQMGGIVSPSWTVNPHLTLRFEYIYNRVVVDKNTYQPHVLRFHIQSALNSKLTTSAFIQYSSDLRLLSANIRLRYSRSEGTDFYLVYNEGINTDLGNPVPPLPRTRGRAILIKYNITFIR
jgi:hypothetical protein